MITHVKVYAPCTVAVRQTREQRQAQILEAACDLFVTKGYHATTVDDIVGRVQVARGTFYLYFPDKRAVLSALVDGFFVRITAAIHSIDLEAADRPALLQLRGNLQRLCELALAEPALMKILLYDVPGLDSELDAKLRDFYAALRRFLEESLAEGQRIGLVREGDRAIMVALGLGGLKEILLTAVTSDEPATAERLTAEIMRFFESGLLARSTG